MKFHYTAINGTEKTVTVNYGTAGNFTYDSAKDRYQVNLNSLPAADFMIFHLEERLFFQSESLPKRRNHAIIQKNGDEAYDCELSYAYVSLRAC